MALADVLRERVSRRGGSALVGCGELGTVTVEALPVRECAALLRGPGGSRAVLYAACRELQAEGEALRKAGKLFRPDEIMDFVSEEEIAGAVQVVLELSGLGQQTAEKNGEARPGVASGTDWEAESSQEPDTAPVSGAPAVPEALPLEKPSAHIQRMRGEEVPTAENLLAPDGEKAPESAVPETALQRGANRPTAFVPKTVETAPLRGVGGEHAFKAQVEAVENFTQAALAVRRETMREHGGAVTVSPAETPARRPKLGREDMQKSRETQTRAAGTERPAVSVTSSPKTAGGTSYGVETGEDGPKSGLSGLSEGQKARVMANISPGGAQNFGGMEEARETDPKPPRRSRPEVLETDMQAPHESKADFREAAHKTQVGFLGGAPDKSRPDSAAAEPEKTHESKMSFRGAAHETQVGFLGGAPDKSRPDSAAAEPERTREGTVQKAAHQPESNFPGERSGESGPNFTEKERETANEAEWELAERVARRILEGLRRCAAVR